jgi:hypothetical protein
MRRLTRCTPEQQQLVRCKGTSEGAGHRTHQLTTCTALPACLQLEHSECKLTAIARVATTCALLQEGARWGAALPPTRSPAPRPHAIMQRQAPTRSLLELPQSCVLTCLGLLDKRDKLALASTCRDVCAAVMRALPQCRLDMQVSNCW